VPIVLGSGSLNLLEPSGPVQACNGIALLLPLPDKRKCTGLHYMQQDHRILPLTEEIGMLYELFHHQVQCVPKVTASSKYLPTVTHLHFTKVPIEHPPPAPPPSKKMPEYKQKYSM
jgi:hypothetical protein